MDTECGPERVLEVTDYRPPLMGDLNVWRYSECADVETMLEWWLADVVEQDRLCDSVVHDGELTACEYCPECEHYSEYLEYMEGEEV